MPRLTLSPSLTLNPNQASLCLRVPTGAFLPCFVTGAALGRALGQLLDGAALLHGVQPGHLAVCGAAALTAAVTRTTRT